jgi:hypothetical protein
VDVIKELTTLSNWAEIVTLDFVKTGLDVAEKKNETSGVNQRKACIKYSLHPTHKNYSVKPV